MTKLERRRGAANGRLDFEALPVGEDNKLVGMITGRDIAVRIVAEGCDPEAITVCQAMSTDFLYCFESESAEDVSRKMGDWWVRRLPVVNPDKRLIGMVSLADLTARMAAPTGEKSKCLHADYEVLVLRGQPDVLSGRRRQRRPSWAGF